MYICYAGTFSPNFRIGLLAHLRSSLSAQSVSFTPIYDHTVVLTHGNSSDRFYTLDFDGRSIGRWHLYDAELFTSVTTFFDILYSLLTTSSGLKVKIHCPWTICRPAAITVSDEMTSSLCSIFLRWGESTSPAFCLVVDNIVLFTKTNSWPLTSLRIVAFIATNDILFLWGFTFFALKPSKSWQILYSPLTVYS